MKFYDIEGGIESTHGVDFYHQLPYGFEVYNLIYTVTPQHLNYTTETGEQAEIDAPPGTCVLYPPHYPRYLRCVDGADHFSNTWIHFAVTDEEAFLGMMAVYDIRPGQLFMLREGCPFNSILRDILYELSVVQIHSGQMITSLIHMLLIQISRNKIPFGTQPDDMNYQQQSRFEALRKQMYNDPNADWRVTAMAEQVFVSTNQFISLYKEYFDVTPKQDIINARIMMAKNLLGTSSVIREVAQSCGFENEFYFSRVFKNKTGMTPGQYIKSKTNVTPIAPFTEP